MSGSIRDTLEEKLARFEQLERNMSDPEILADGARMSATAREHGGLAKVARLQKANVLLLSELALAMRPVVSPGDEVELNLVKEGRDEHQAVGYLPDGTMIVVNRAVELIGSMQWVVVAGAVQTSAGRLIFAELRESSQA
jgi:uncharacterized protein YacL